jgi:hypothetical protein
MDDDGVPSKVPAVGSEEDANKKQPRGPEAALFFFE